MLELAGSLDADGIAVLGRGVTEAARRARGRDLVLDLSAVQRCDTAGATLIAAADDAHGAAVALRGASPGALMLIARVRALEPTVVTAEQARLSPAVLPGLGGVAVATVGGVARAGLGGVTYLGDIAIASARLPGRRRMLRLGELATLMQQAGSRALPLVAFVGLLLGLIMAFQSSIPLRRYGGEIYVVNLVAQSVLRELGPVVAAIVLAGRTGSAFAAELGTMSINSEIAALTTIGADPVTMLVLPRLVAAVLVMPALTLGLELAALVGMAIVMRGLGFPLVAVIHQLGMTTHLTDLFGGLFKACVFGLAVAAIGCRAGLAAGSGPRAVGVAAPGAVVGGLVACMLLDALFAALYYRIGV